MPVLFHTSDAHQDSSCRQAACEEKSAQEYRTTGDLPLAIAADAAATRFRANHLRASRSYEAAADAYRVAARDAAHNARRARSNQARADQMSAESLRRDAVTAVSSALRAQRKVRLLLRQEERLTSNLAALKAREAKACEQAKARLEEGRVAHEKGDFSAASKLESAASMKRSQAAHVAAQAAVASERLKQKQTETLSQKSVLDDLVAASREQEQLRRSAVQQSLQSAAQDAANGAKEARQRLQDCCDDAAAVRSDAEQLHLRAEVGGAFSKSSELLKSCAAALLEHAASREADGVAEEREAYELEHQAHDLQQELEQYLAKWQTEPLLPEGLRSGVDICGDDGVCDYSLGPTCTGQVELLEALESARALCSSSAEDVQERVVALEQFRATLAEQVAQLPEGKNQSSLAGSESGNLSSLQSSEAHAGLSSGCGAATMMIAPGAKTYGLELLAERDSALAILERQGVAADNHAALLASLADQMRDALAAVDAAAACGRQRANLRGAADDLRVELSAVKDHLEDASKARVEAIGRAQLAIDAGEANLAEECMAEVHEQLRRQAELANTEADLVADLDAVEHELPLDALEVCSYTLTVFTTFH
jgi:hypothetical protein